MDLPTCPSCGQSVLDDDVDDCPFCGASMTGKPSSQPKQASSAAGASPATVTVSPEKAATEKTGGGQQKKETTAGEEEDPFELERAAAKKKRVVPLHPRPQPGRRHRVVCPMCETPGFTARKAAGRDVRCANPDCRFPVFTAPPLEEEELTETANRETDETPPSKRLVTPLNLGAGIAVLAVALLVMWYIGFGTQKQSRPNPLDNTPSTPSGKSLAQRKTEKTAPLQAGKKKQTPVDPALQRKKIRDEALVRIQRDAADERQTDLTKIVSRHFAADAFALAGDFPAAENLLEKLKRVTQKGGRFYRVRPLVSLAWGSLQKGTEAGRRKADRFAEEAKAILEVLPSDVGPEGYSAAARTAATLIALNRPEEAERLIARFDRSDSAARESLLLLVVEEFRIFDVEAARKLQPPYTPASPLRVSVTLLLAARGKWNAAQNWAGKQTDRAVRSECLSAWAEARLLATQKPAGQNVSKTTTRSKTGSGSSSKKSGAKSGNRLPSPAEVAARLPAEYRALLLSRFAMHLHNLGHREEAQRLLAEARKILENISVPPAGKTPGVRDVMSRKPLPAAEKQRREIAASAAAQWAQARLIVDPQRVQEAWNSLQRALHIGRSLSYSYADLERLKNVSEAEIGRAMNVKQAADIARLALDYRDRLRARQKEADARFRFQTRILEQAGEWGFPALLPHIWNGWIAGENAAGKKDGPEKISPATASADPWFTTLVPWMLAFRLEEAGEKTLAAAIRERIDQYRQQHRQRENRRTVLWVRVHYELGQGQPDYKQLGRFFAPGAVDPGWRRLLALHITARLVNRQQAEAARQFARALDRDRVLQIDAFHLLGGLMARRSGPAAVWKMIEQQPLNPWESAALCHGLVMALIPPAGPPPKPGEENSAANTTSTAETSTAEN